MARLLRSTRRGSNGAWQRFERGEIPLFTFYEQFGQDLSDTVRGNVWYREYCARKGLGVLRAPPPPSMLARWWRSCPSPPSQNVPRSLKDWISTAERYAYVCFWALLPETAAYGHRRRQLFGRMMHEGGTMDERVVEAIRRIRGAFCLFFASHGMFTTRLISFGTVACDRAHEQLGAQRPRVPWRGPARPCKVRAPPTERRARVPGLARRGCPRTTPGDVRRLLRFQRAGDAVGGS